MKILAVYPLHNQDIRIQPLFRIIHKFLVSFIDEHLFINENSNDQTAHVAKLEYEKLKTPFKYIDINRETNRAESFITALEYAKSREFDYIIFFNEGWEDNIYEMLSIIRSKEFLPYNLTTSVRKTKDFSIGSLLDKLCSILMSLRFKVVIQDTKGDSINIVRVKELELSESFKKDIINLKENYYLLVLKKLRKHLFFTDVDNGYNSSSFLKLNLRRFCVCLYFSLKR